MAHQALSEVGPAVIGTDRTHHSSMLEKTSSHSLEEEETQDPTKRSQVASSSRLPLATAGTAELEGL